MCENTDHPDEIQEIGEALYVDTLNQSVFNGTSARKSYWLLGVKERKEGNVLFNDALNTSYLWLYGVKHMVKDHSDSKRGNPLPPYGLLFSISSKASFICIIPQTG